MKMIDSIITAEQLEYLAKVDFSHVVVMNGKVWPEQDLRFAISTAECMMSPKSGNHEAYIFKSVDKGIEYVGMVTA